MIHTKPDTLVAGTTLREYFAGLAMQGMLANPEALRNYFVVDGQCMTVVQAAVYLAQALCAELGKEKA